MHQTSQKPRYSVANFLIYIMAPAFSQIAHLVFRKSSIHKTSEDRTALAVIKRGERKICSGYFKGI